MGRYTGPKTRVSRRYGVQIFGPSKSLERKNYPPGMHGPKGSRRKQSEYAIALGEKQKLRYQYGLLERQFRRIFENALRKRGVTGETLLQLLETRLDNVIFRLGLANTRNGARQLSLMINAPSYATDDWMVVDGWMGGDPSANVGQIRLMLRRGSYGVELPMPQQTFTNSDRIGFEGTYSIAAMRLPNPPRGNYTLTATWTATDGSGVTLFAELSVTIK